MLWVKFWHPIARLVASAGPTLVAARSPAYNARRSPGRPARTGPFPKVDHEGNQPNMTRLRGSVKWFDPEKGWGFIRLEDGNEVFVHHSDIQGSGFRSLRDGAEVELDVERADRGPRARNVTRLDGETSEEGSSNQASASSRDQRGSRNDSGHSRSRTNRRGHSDSGGSRQTRQPAGAAAELQTLAEQIRQRLASRFRFLR
jgi:CspA family cold shock protein